MTDEMNDEFDDWPIDDLRLVLAERCEMDDGTVLYCIYSKKYEAVTFVSAEEVSILKGKGIITIDVLPE